ncbi:MAG: hypothetical protein Q4P84_03925 [Elusimicrobiales bacterium]|nr:hypothetical protein [Elusimicrobiales bacterium]
MLFTTGSGAGDSAWVCVFGSSAPFLGFKIVTVVKSRINGRIQLREKKTMFADKKVGESSVLSLPVGVIKSHKNISTEINFPMRGI